MRRLPCAGEASKHGCMAAPVSSASTDKVKDMTIKLFVTTTSAASLLACMYCVFDCKVLLDF